MIVVDPKDSTMGRLYSVSPLFEAGNLFPPESAQWVRDFVEELTGFPNAQK